MYICIYVCIYIVHIFRWTHCTINYFFYERASEVFVNVLEEIRSDSGRPCPAPYVSAAMRDVIFSNKKLHVQIILN